MGSHYTNTIKNRQSLYQHFMLYICLCEVYSHHVCISETVVVKNFTFYVLSNLFDFDSSFTFLLLFGLYYWSFEGLDLVKKNMASLFGQEPSQGLNNKRTIQQQP